MAMNPRLLRPTANDSPASIPGLALWLDASASDALYTTDAGPVEAVSSPLDISGCVGWWDADDDSTVSVDANDKVTAWADKSGSGYSMDQATESRRPLYLASGINGRKSIEFDIANGRQLIGAFTESMTAATVFVVNVVPDQASNAGRMLTLWPNDAVNSQDTTGSSSWVPLVRGTSNAFYSSLVAGPSYVAGYVVPQFGSQQILTSQHSGTAISQFYNGLLYGTGAHTLNATFTHIGINTYTLLAFAGYSNQTTGEVIVYNTALSTSDRARVEAYLAAKWGISGVHAPAVTASDPVGYWRDRSGNGRHATQSTAASRPVVGSQNGRKALTFANANSIETQAYPAKATSTYIYVGRHSETADVYFQTGVTNLFHSHIVENVSKFRRNESGNSGVVLGSNIGLNQLSIWAPTYSNSLLEVRRNGATIGSTTTAATVADANVATSIGRFPGGSATYPLAGDICEFLVYSRALTATERRRVEVYLARRWGIALAPQVGNAEAQDWISRVYANGGTVSQSTASAVSTMCDAIESAGIRDRFYRLNLFCGDNLNAALVPLYRGPTFGGTAYGNATDTNNGPFVSGDYVESVGLTKNVSATKYLDTGLAPDDLPSIATGHIAAYRGAGAAVNEAILGLRDSGGTHYYEIFKRGDSRHHAAWGGTSIALPATEAAHEDAGFLLASRTSSTSLTLYRDGVSIATQGATITPAGTDRHWFLFALNTGSPTSLWAIDVPIMGYSIGDGMDAAETAAFSSAMQTFQTALGRA